MKLKINEDLLAKQGKIKNGEIRVTSKRDLVEGKSRKTVAVNYCWNCGDKFISKPSEHIHFCCGGCATEYFKRKRGLI